MPFRDYETLELDDAALVSIDVQRGFDHERWGERNNPDAERHVAELLATFHEAELPVVHVRHDSTELDLPLRDRPDNAFESEAEPTRGEPVVAKEVNGAFPGTPLEHRLALAQLSEGLATVVETATLLAALEARE